MQVSISEASRNLSHWINEASYGSECVVLTSRGRPKAVLVGMDLFESLLGITVEMPDQPLSVDELRQGFRQALAQAGYASRTDILALVDEVKRELAAERAVTLAETVS
ncbi:MAG: type II toxin-antitoxin system Phd/YefM family antitoxin [Caldilineaceae bacterium]